MKKLLFSLIFVIICVVFYQYQLNQMNLESVKKSEIASHETIQFKEFTKAYAVMKRSCMPCHNKDRVGYLIQAVKRLDFQEIEGETKPRIVGSLEGLEQMISEGANLSFTSQIEVRQFLKNMPGGLFTMVSKGVMPPPWAPELMRKLKRYEYIPLSKNDRRALLQYALKKKSKE